MPWHDVGVMVGGAAARDVARHFIQRWNAVKVFGKYHNQSARIILAKHETNSVIKFTLICLLDIFLYDHHDHD